jgi:hypothetical protein
VSSTGHGAALLRRIAKSGAAYGSGSHTKRISSDLQPKQRVQRSAVWLPSGKEAHPYIQRDIHEGTSLGDAECVGAKEAHDADAVLATAYLRNCIF